MHSTIFTKCNLLATLQCCDNFFICAIPDSYWNRQHKEFVPYRPQICCTTDLLVILTSIYWKLFTSSIVRNKRYWNKMFVIYYNQPRHQNSSLWNSCRMIAFNIQANYFKTWSKGELFKFCENNSCCIHYFI